MFNKIYLYLAGLVAAIGGALALYFKGRSAGKQVEQAKAVKVELQQERAKNETLQQVNEVANDVGGLSDADAEQRLRDKYTRD